MSRIGSKFGYKITGEDDTATLIVLFPGERPLGPMTNDNPFFQKAVSAAIAQDESVREMFDPSQVIGAHFKRIGDRVTVVNNTIFYDGAPMDGAIEQQILRTLDSDDVDADLDSLVRFYEKLMLNPNAHSREQLYRWLKTHDFTITPEGDIVGYKGVRADYMSQHAGRAIVDGTVIEGQVPNRVGSIIEMRRDDVQHDPSSACSTGLHVGTYRFASTFISGGITLAVKIDPRDVVSVPTAAGDAKMRVCRYAVMEVVNQAYDTQVLRPEQEEEEVEANAEVMITVTTNAERPSRWWQRFTRGRRA